MSRIARPGIVRGLRIPEDAGRHCLPAEGWSEARMDIMIPGAGIAGLMIAYRLRRYGFTPTIAGRALDGQNRFSTWVFRLKK